MKPLLTALGLVLITASSAATPAGAAAHAFSGGVCAPAPLAEAQQYNGFFLASLDGHESGIDGRLAVAGNAALSDYSVGVALPATPPQDVLVVGGSLQFAHGTINGNAVYGIAAAVANVSMGAGSVHRGTPISFAAAQSDLDRLVAALRALPVTGKTSERYSALNLRGSNRVRDVFHVSALRLAHAHAVQINVPSGATAVVVVAGKTISMANLGLSVHGAAPAHTLFVFPSAVSLTIHSAGLKASLLAPQASLTFNDGAIVGTVVAASFTGTGHLSPQPFAGCLPALPGTSGR